MPGCCGFMISKSREAGKQGGKRRASISSNDDQQKYIIMAMASE